MATDVIEENDLTAPDLYTQTTSDLLESGQEVRIIWDPGNGGSHVL